MQDDNRPAGFELEIITPRKVVTYLVHSVEIESPTGSFTVAENHAALISSLKKKGVVTFQINTDNTHTIHVENGGLFSVANNKAQLILHQPHI